MECSLYIPLEFSFQNIQEIISSHHAVNHTDVPHPQAKYIPTLALLTTPRIFFLFPSDNPKSFLCYPTPMNKECFSINSKWKLSKSWRKYIYVVTKTKKWFDINQSSHPSNGKSWHVMFHMIDQEISWAPSQMWTQFVI